MKIVDLKQDSPEWHIWRLKHLGASDAPIVLGTSPWTTPEQLWALKTGKIPPIKTNGAMQSGKDLEPIAREQYVKMVGIEMEPICGESDELAFMAASFDGINRARGIALEIKCPGRADHETATAGRVPEKYTYQLAQQFYVSGFDLIHYVSYSPQSNSLAVVEVNRDNKMIQNLVEKSLQFWDKVLKNKWE